jgi:hypothetical protein
MIGRILVGLAALALVGFVALALIGLWDRYSREATALGFSGPYERYLASQAGFPDDPKAYRASEAEHRRKSGIVVGVTTAHEE